MSWNRADFLCKLTNILIYVLTVSCQSAHNCLPFELNRIRSISPVHQSCFSCTNSPANLQSLCGLFVGTFPRRYAGDEVGVAVAADSGLRNEEKKMCISIWVLVVHIRWHTRVSCFFSLFTFSFTSSVASSMHYLKESCECRLSEGEFHGISAGF